MEGEAVFDLIHILTYHLKNASIDGPVKELFINESFSISSVVC